MLASRHYADATLISRHYYYLRYANMRLIIIIALLR